MNYFELIDQVASLKELEALRIRFLGKDGIISSKIKALASLSITERKIQGAVLNNLKNDIAAKIDQKKACFTVTHKSDLDFSFPISSKIGRQHILTHSIDQLDKIFNSMGFQKIFGPDVESSFYNFEALNIPPSHPARDNNDTFYLQDGSLLRTHVTAVQIRLLESLVANPHDFRAYSIGRVFRNDSHDATHVSMFHQVEGIIVEDGVSMRHLKGFLEYLLANFFGKEIPVRFRPSYFPFTEPSCEVDIPAIFKNDRLEISTWDSGKPIEIGGCGIIHPAILRRFNFDGRQAFAFGLGLERWVMLKYGISNINIFYDNHIPFISFQD